MTAGSCPISVCGKTTPIFTVGLRRASLRYETCPLTTSRQPRIRAPDRLRPDAMRREGPAMKKTMLGVVVLLQVLVLHLAGAGAQAPRPPIKIGFTADLTGIAAQPAKDMVNGFT